MTTLSAVLCAYNEQAHLPAQLWALQHQSRPADELVLLNDGSTDGTAALLAGVRGTPPPTRGWHSPPAGPCVAYNLAAGQATGDWLYLASANDVVQPGAFEAWAKQVAVWPEAVLMAGDLATIRLGWAPTSGFLSPVQLVTRWQQGSMLHGAGVFVRRDAWEAAGGYDPALQWLADWWLYHTLALRYGCVYLAAPIAHVRPLPGGFSRGYQDAGRLAVVTAALAERLDDPANADMRDGFLSAGLLDIPEAGAGRVQQLLQPCVAVGV